MKHSIFIFGLLLPTTLASYNTEVIDVDAGSSDYSILAGQCTVFRFDVEESDAPNVASDEDDDSDGINSDGGIKNFKFDITIDSTSSTLEYFALLIPSDEGDEVINNVTSVFSTTSSSPSMCWSNASKVPVSALYSSDAALGPDPIAVDMTSKSKKKYAYSQSCITYIGTYYLVVVANQDSTFSLSVDTKKLGAFSCLSNAAVAAIIIGFSICCGGCVCCACMLGVGAACKTKRGSNPPASEGDVAMQQNPSQPVQNTTVVQGGFIQKPEYSSQPVSGTVVQGGYTQPVQGYSSQPVVVQGGYTQPVQGYSAQPVSGTVVQGGYTQPNQGYSAQPVSGTVVQGGYTQPNQGYSAQPVSGTVVQGNVVLGTYA